ncbi:MAG: amino acid adenylation domain-containing protein [Hydrogenophilales bacterium]|nr:amino acid adenylation domain-containing protein [Hydrogenophilales bacterium]
MRKSFLERMAALSPTQRALLERRLARSVSDTGPRIARAPRDDMVRASFSQERMWLVHQMYPNSIAYNSQVAIHFRGHLDVAALTRSLDELVRRHEIYRTCFVETGGFVYQRIYPPSGAHLHIRDLPGDSSETVESWVRKAIREEISQPFRLDELPLTRWALLRIDADQHTLICIEHHAVTDGWARNVALTELMALYAAFAADRQPSLPDPILQFADFAYWQRQWLASAEGRAQLEYWTRQLAGAPDFIDLPYDRAHPMRPSFRGGHETMVLGEDELRPLRKIAAKSQATMFMALLSVFIILLHRYSRADDLCVGTGIANRRLPDTDQLVGMLINTIVLRIDVSGDPGFRDVLRRVREVTLDGYANQEAPFDKVVEALAPPRRPGSNPLHQVTFNLQNNPMPAMSFPGLTATLERPLFNDSAKYDLFVAGWPRSEIRRGAWQREDEAILLSWEYNADVFDVATVRVMQGHFRNLLRAAGNHPELVIGALRMDDEDACRLVAQDWSPDVQSYSEQCIASLFAEQVARYPSAVALEQDARQWTYLQLDERSDALVPYLRRTGVEQGKVVAIAMERSPELIAAMLAVLKAGGAYMPLDLDYPAGYLATLLTQCRPVCILTTAVLAERLPVGDIPIAIYEQIPSVPEEAVAPAAGSPPGDRLAYILFTSGTTGMPRAVAVPNRGVVRLVNSSQFARMDASQIWLQLSPLTFDASTLEIWAPLCNGGRLVLMPPGLPSLDDIGAALRQYGITSLWLSAGLAQLMVSERLEELAGLTQLLTGGDTVPLGLARRLLGRYPEIRLINGYGPTENTTFTTCHTVDASDLARSRLPIGRPIAGTTVYILDALGRPCPIGVPGELYTGGAGLALGYWNDAHATADRFIIHAEFGRLYRTGDLCRYHHDGTLDYLGRLDGQVKVRGFRIELGEVESVLRGHPGVRACVVAARGESAADKVLVAYVVAADDEPPSDDSLRSYLRQRLPAHALPTRFRIIGQIPLTANGKIDYGALPDVREDSGCRTAPAAGPRTSLEEIVAGVWREVLGRTDLGLHEDFFDAGGHSLEALKVLAMIKAQTGIEIGTLDFFEQPTIAGIAARAEQRAMDTTGHSRPGRFLVELQSRVSGMPLFIVPGGWGEPNEILVFAAIRSHMATDGPIYALRSRATDRFRPVPEHIDQQAADLLDTVKEVSQKGAFVLLGECAASTVVMAMAALAEHQGRTVDSVVLLDPGPVSHLRSLTERMACFTAGDAVQNTESLPVDVAQYYRLLGTWSPRPVRCDLHILLSSRFPDVESVRNSWAPLANGQLHVHSVSGDHISYLREAAADTARVLDIILASRRLRHSAH